MVCASASVCHHGQKLWAAERMAALVDRSSVPSIQISYDSTPMRVLFGALQDQLMPVARYAVQTEEGGRWTTVSYDEFIRKYGGSRMVRFGIVEVLGAKAAFTVMSDDDVLRGFDILCRPSILARSN
eukprot:4007826-Pyramimonas_sp.AAC.1